MAARVWHDRQIERRTFAIRFDFPGDDDPIFAGLHKGALGFAPSLQTAMLYGSSDEAYRYLHNGYGEETQKWGRVIEVKGGNPV